MNRRSFLKLIGSLPLLGLIPKLQSPDDVFRSDKFDKMLSIPTSFGIDYAKEGGYELPSYINVMALREKGRYSVVHTVRYSDKSLQEIAKLRGVTLDE